MEITHPFHPLRGQRFQILRIRRVSSIETLVLAGSCLGTFSVHKEWTDKAPPSDHHENLPVLNFKSLLDLKATVANLHAVSKKELDNV